VPSQFNWTLQLHPFLTLALDEVNGQLYGPDALPSGHKPLVYIKSKVGGRGGGADLEVLEKRQITCPCQESNYDSWVFQPLA